jgi:cytochrome b subunit of formate dehydrogenase
MNINFIVVLVLILTGLEIFFNTLTKIVRYIISIFGIKVSISEKTYTVIKLIVVALFLASVIYFLILFVKVLASWLGIPLDKSIIDFFK